MSQDFQHLIQWIFYDFQWLMDEKVDPGMWFGMLNIFAVLHSRTWFQNDILSTRYMMKEWKIK
jgi:hypothetical protein